MSNEKLNETQNNISVVNVLLLAQKALRNASGAYEALRLLGAEKHLPGLDSCESTRKEALKSVDDYLRLLQVFDKI